MTSTASLRLVQQVRFEGAIEDKAMARDTKDAAISEQKQKIGEVYDQRLTQISADREAREAEGLGRLIGSLVLPFVGTLIGGAIGRAAGDGDRDLAAASKKGAGLDAIERDRAQDEVGRAMERLEDASADVQGIEKFGRELRAEAERSSGL
jgi:hypothetical protein